MIHQTFPDTFASKLRETSSPHKVFFLQMHRVVFQIYRIEVFSDFSCRRKAGDPDTFCNNIFPN